MRGVVAGGRVSCGMVSWVGFLGVWFLGLGFLVVGGLGSGGLEIGCLGFRGLSLFVSEILAGQGGMQNRQPRDSYGYIRGGEP